MLKYYEIWNNTSCKLFGGVDEASNSIIDWDNNADGLFSTARLISITRQSIINSSLYFPSDKLIKWSNSSPFAKQPGQK